MGNNHIKKNEKHNLEAINYEKMNHVEKDSVLYFMLLIFEQPGGFLQLISSTFFLNIKEHL
jgi:hypothetical protein